MYNKRPFIPKNTVVWDTKIVLDFLEAWHPAKNLSLRQLSIKTVLLCLLVSGQRGQTIWLMCLENVKVFRDRITCAIGDPTKTTNASRHTSELVFKEYNKKSLCVKHYLAQYINRTKPLRSKEKGGGGAKAVYHYYSTPFTNQEGDADLLGESGALLKWGGFRQVFTSFYEISLNQQSEVERATCDYHEISWLEESDHLREVLRQGCRERRMVGQGSVLVEVIRN